MYYVLMHTVYHFYTFMYITCICRHQFPQPPTPSGKGRIPAWQKSVSVPAVLPSTDSKGIEGVLAEEQEETEPLVVVNGQGESSDDADKDEGLKDEGLMNDEG